MSEIPRREDFEANVNGPFVIHFSDEVAIEAKLTEVIELKRSDKLESFSLLFVVPDAPISQNTYRVDNAALGSLELFLVPVGQTDDGIQYEAIFNNLVPKG